MKCMLRFASGAQSLNSRRQKYLTDSPKGETGFTATGRPQERAVPEIRTANSWTPLTPTPSGERGYFDFRIRNCDTFVQTFALQGV